MLALATGCVGQRKKAPLPVPTSTPRAEAPRLPPPPIEQAPEPARPTGEPPLTLSQRKPIYGLPGFGPHEFTAEGQRLRYRLFEPAPLEPGRLYPLVLYLHSASGSGSDNISQLNGSRSWGPAFWSSRDVQQRHPAFVLAPQADPRYADTWVRQWRPAAAGGPLEPLELTLLLLDQLEARAPIDPDRIYITGYSMGGFGAWLAISRHPRRFAAAIPIAGGGDPTFVASTEAAVWAFHGAADPVVPVRRSREMVRALRSAGRPVRYTEYPDASHNLFWQVYEEEGLADWLFAQRRASSFRAATVRERPTPPPSEPRPFRPR